MDRAYEKDNAFTRLDRQVKEINQGRGMTRGGAQYNTAEPPPSVRSAAMREPLPPVLPQSEIDRLNKLAAEQGVEGYERPEEYKVSLADAPALPRMNQYGEVLTRPFLPDFSKIQSIDLVRNVVVVDGVYFEFDEEQRDPLIRFCMDTVLDTFTKLVAKAAVKYNLFGAKDGPTTEGTTQGQSTETREEPSPAIQPAVPSRNGDKPEGE